jgi:Ca2+-binding EF-hand superfamily protein
VKVYNEIGSSAEPLEAKLRELFKAVDGDNDGFLTTVELEKA